MSEMQHVGGKSKIKKDFFEHMETSFGRVEKGWRISTPSNDVQVIKTTPGYISDANIYVSLGLSNSPYPLRNSGRHVRCELFFILPGECDFLHIPSIIEDVVTVMEKSGTAFLRGDVIGPKGELFEGHDFTSLYVAPPFLLPDESYGFMIEGEEVLFMWLVPITTAECEFVRQYGWERFEDRLEEMEVDVINIDRNSVA